MEKRRKWIKTYQIVLLLLFPAALLILAAAKKSIFFAEEIMAKRIYKVLCAVISTLTGWIPFSLAELLVLLAPILLLIFLIFTGKQLLQDRDGRLYCLLQAVIRLACTASVIYFLYVIGCGVNYHRVGIAEACGLLVQPSSKEELNALCLELAAEATELRADLTAYEDETGVLRNPVSNRELGRMVQASYQQLSKKLPVLSGWYPAPKSIYFSRVFSSMELTGVFTCWTMEANVNVDITDYDIANTMAHELGHVHGFMREDEANFLSYLACRESDSALVRYSGTMLALVYCGNALAGQDMELYRQLWQSYGEGILRDIAANLAYWKQFEDTVISNTVDKVNDTYLKANDQEDGVKSYGRVVDLLLADYRSRQEAEKEETYGGDR